MDYGELGFIAISRNDYQEAINIFRRALLKKKNAKNFLGLGIAHYKLGDFKTARWAFYKALELEPDNKDIISYIVMTENINDIKKEADRKKDSIFRTGKDYLEIYKKGWCKFFVKGINIGLGLPGYFPGEYPIKKGTYLKWFKQIAELGFNSIRIYTIHPPCFYEALYQYNEESEKKLYLFQGIWVELPENNDFYNKNYMQYVRSNIKDALSVVYGDATLPERPGYPSGPYIFDVSNYTAAFIFGREWESCAVKGFNERYGRVKKDYKGNFLKINNGAPFEIWVTEICDFLQSYEYDKYKVSHPVSVVTWPTLDPIIHPSESNYEDELILQGINVKKGICNENEDMESMDMSGVKSVTGNGFFITYHIYPYYPDFMNNDYVHTDNTYLNYLLELKKYHENLPVLIGEFGVPSSRESAHWHSRGWNQGGHDELKQGEINSILMKSIEHSGMAGGIIFSWFDEWYKRNWVFLPYELPPDRNPLWFNFLDPEQNYGLLAAYPGYPGKKVNLYGNKEEWKGATVLYEKKEGLIFEFHDGSDESRMLRRLLVQHDEGFLYVLIETKGAVDFQKSNYLIGLDTCDPLYGEFLLPFNTELLSPVGLKFLIHLAGKEKSRILVCHSYDRYLNNEVRPLISEQGSWVIMQNKTNNRRISKDGSKFYPSRVYSMSNLRFGTLCNESRDYNSLADFYYRDNMIELRIPWSLINFTDPSSRMVLWMEKENKIRKTDGIRIIVLSYKPVRGHIIAEKTGLKNNITDSLPHPLKAENVRTYSWDEWDVPVFHFYLKEGYSQIKEFLSRIDSP
ncbi:MAG: hypothetical protein N2257_03660 [Thermodesulfovibrionales bacterium]|nr:hypothetical protein [Thermodesulfovibrionales bacterium]